MKNKGLGWRSGFTILELVVTLLIIGMGAVIALSVYRSYIPKAQAMEAYTLMETERNLIAMHLFRGQCTMDGEDSTFTGKYGVLTVSGNPEWKNGRTCPTGCVMTYTFNSTGVDVHLSGTSVVSDFLMGGAFSKNTELTTTPEQYLPRLFKAIPVAAGDQCGSMI